MQSFGKKLIPFIMGASLFWILGWFQTNHYAPEGDLIRSSYLICRRHYPDHKPLAKTADTSFGEILLVGDSHLDQSPKNRRFQNHLDINVSSHSYFAYEASNPFSLGVNLSLQEPPKLIVFEVVERTFTHFAKDFLEQYYPKKPRTIPNLKRQVDFGHYHLGSGARTAASLFHIRHKWCQNDKCNILTCSSQPPLYSNDKILLIQDTWKRPPAREALQIMEELKKDLAKRLNPEGIDFLIYVIPDKATVYSDFFVAADLPPSFLLESTLPSSVFSPILEMREAVNMGTMEVFKYSDTHLGESGAKIAGEHLNDILTFWTKSQL